MTVNYKIIFVSNKKEIFFTKYETMLKYIKKIEDDDSYVVLKNVNDKYWMDMSEYVKG